MSAPAIRCAGLGKSFGGAAVLRDLSLTVGHGELLGLVGPNGAGKSTLLRLLLGLVSRDAGELSVLGLDPARDAVAIAARTGYLPGETGVYLQMTGAQFLAFCRGFHPRRDDARERRLADAFALPLAGKVRSYSAGMKQKLALLATLAPDLDLYLLDEPDRALDASMRMTLRDELRAMKAAGKTIVLSSHHLFEIESLADRLVFFWQGALLAADDVAAARARLRRRPRLRLQPGASLPAGARELRREPDDTLVVETDGDPMAWLRSVPDGVVEGAEIGVPRLDDLYDALFADLGKAGSR
ncbi:MAG: ATP-binding cassette domain-containing protein [Planctomycetes bacterium]|nr:ATP-binding cassette domain-containing protein [Planctomycetota bacterium]